MKVRLMPIMLASLAFLLSGAAFGAIRPRFLARDVGWSSTDIVIANEKQAPGTFEVVEPWKGMLRAGDRIFVPGMAEWQRPANRTITDESAKSTGMAVTTHRLLLFLVRENKQPVESKRTSWAPATFWKTWQTSFVWLQDGSAYGHEQGTFAMGPSTLHEVARSEDELRGTIMGFAAERDEFDRALAIDSPDQRAYAVTNFLASQNPSACLAAIQELKKMGPAALPALRAALQRPDLLPRRGDIALAMADVGKADAGPDLLAYIERDAGYWSGNASRLSPGWWNDVAHLQEYSTDKDHYRADVCALGALIQIRYAPAIDAIQRFCNSWSKVPPLDLHLPSNQMPQKCDEALHVLADRHTVE